MRTIICSLFFSLSASMLSAQETIVHEGLEADWYSAGGETAVLLLHGTLAHNRMEVIHTIAEIVSGDHDLPVLAPNLSYNIPGRTGMLDCTVTHRHKHSDAAKEITQWVNYLADQGYARIVVSAHSRGGAQLSEYLVNAAHPAVVGAVLIAPATFDASRQSAGYQRRYGVPLEALIADASQRPADEIMRVPGFVYCANAEVTAASFLDYYAQVMFRDTPTNLASINVPVTVVAGSADDVVSDLPDRLAAGALNDRITLEVLEGADHFFRDLYADDVATFIAERAAP